MQAALQEILGFGNRHLFFLYWTRQGSFIITWSLQGPSNIYTCSRRLLDGWFWAEARENMDSLAFHHKAAHKDKQPHTTCLNSDPYCISFLCLDPFLPMNAYTDMYILLTDVLVFLSFPSTLLTPPLVSFYWCSVVLFASYSLSESVTNVFLLLKRS